MYTHAYHAYCRLSKSVSLLSILTSQGIIPPGSEYLCGRSDDDAGKVSIIFTVGLLYCKHGNGSLLDKSSFSQECKYKI